MLRFDKVQCSLLTDTPESARVFNANKQVLVPRKLSRPQNRKFLLVRDVTDLLKLLSKHMLWLLSVKDHAFNPVCLFGVIAAPLQHSGQLKLALSD